MKKYILGLAVLSTLALSGCGSAKKVPYVVEAETIPAEALAQAPAVKEPIIVAGDMLSIVVTSTNMKAAMPFNKGHYVDSEGRMGDIYKQTTSGFMSASEASASDTYLVNNEGDIEFPVLGKVHVGGLTKAQVSQLLVSDIWPQYIKEKPAVDVRISNFRVTVLGEVRSPGVVRSPSEHLNIFEALAMCGDLTIKGRRDNVLLIRTNSNGTRELVRLNLQDKNLLLSPYYQLQQNDQIYVEPNKSAANASWALSPGVSAALTFVGGISSIASLVIGIVNLSK